LRGTETILLVDDEPTVLRVTKRMLETLGYTVHAIDSGPDAVAFFRARMNTIDLVILDMIMPKLSGSETFDRIRELSASAKVILSSGYSMDSDARRIMGKGCAGFIQKPYSIASLSRKIRDVIEKKTP
jgi:CheY-like chemotaxis protein